MRIPHSRYLPDPLYITDSNLRCFCLQPRIDVVEHVYGLDDGAGPARWLHVLPLSCLYCPFHIERGVMC